MAHPKFPAALIFCVISTAATVRAISWKDSDLGPWSENCYFRGQDIANVLVPGERCAQACADNPSCTHFSWTNYNGGTCWLKGGLASRDSAVATFEGVNVCGLNAARTPSAGFHWRQGDEGTWAFGCNFLGQDIGNVKARGEHCGKACRNKQGCTHFIWTRHGGGICWLKGGHASRDNAVPSNWDETVCGLINDPAAGSSTTLSPEVSYQTCRGYRQAGISTSFWNCAKPSCASQGEGKTAFLDPVVQSCAADGRTPVDKYQRSGSLGGPAFVCTQQQPIIVNENLAYGFAAKSMHRGQSERDCCKCYQLNFNGILSGKSMIVQVTDGVGDEVGNELASAHFDLQIPGGGVGDSNACSAQYPDEVDSQPWIQQGRTYEWGHKYGGVNSREECNGLPQPLHAGCQFRWDWMNGVSNANHTYCEVPCPKELTDITKCAP